MLIVDDQLFNYGTNRGIMYRRDDGSLCAVEMPADGFDHVRARDAALTAKPNTTVYLDGALDRYDPAVKEWLGL